MAQLVRQMRVVPQATPGGAIQTPVAFFAADGVTPLILAGTASPALTGTPTAPKAAKGTSTTQLATTSFVQENAGKSKTEIVALAAIATADLVAEATASATALTAAAVTGAAGATPTQAEYATMVTLANDLRSRVAELVALTNSMKTKYNLDVTLTNGVKAATNSQTAALKA